MEILNDNDIIIKDDDGKETLMKILFSYDNEERNATYVFVYEPNNEDVILYYEAYSTIQNLLFIFLKSYKEIFEFSSLYEDYLRADTPNKFWLVNTNKVVY